MSDAPSPMWRLPELPMLSRGEPWSEIDHFLFFFAEFTENAILDALNQFAETVEEAAKGTSSYNDDTGATRASTIAYVHFKGYVPAEVGEAIIAAESLRPGSTSAESIPPDNRLGDRNLALTVMSATNYSWWLNVRKGGENAYLEDALLPNLAEFMDTMYRYLDSEVAILADLVKTWQL